MTAQELKTLIKENGADDIQSILNVLEDGEALAELGVTDDDQGAVEDLHHDLIK